MILRWILSYMVIIKIYMLSVRNIWTDSFLFNRKVLLKIVFLCLTTIICSDRLSIWISTRI